MGRKAKIKANRKKRGFNKSSNNIKRQVPSDSLNEASQQLNRLLCNIGVAFEGKDGKLKATQAVVKGCIPGWEYDLKEKTARRTEPEQNLRIVLDFDEKNACEEVSKKYVTINNLQREAKLYLEEKNMSMFEQTWTKLKRLLPQSQEANFYNDRGCDYDFSPENIGEAIKNFNLAIFLNPYHALAYYNKGVYYSRIKNYQKAIESFDLSIDIEPGNSHAYVERGMAFSKSGGVENAIQDYNRALTLDPNLVEPYLNLGCTFSQTGNYQSAIQNYNIAIKLDNNDADVYYNRAQAYFRLEYYQEALNDYEKSADIYKKQGNFSDLQDALNRIRETKEIQESQLKKEVNKVIIFEDETLKESDNRIIIEVTVRYEGEDNECTEQYYDVVLKEDGNSYDERIKALVRQAIPKPWTSMSWIEPG